MTIFERSEKLLPYMTEIRRHIHSCPGVGFDNRETMDYIKKQLTDIGIYANEVGKCGLSALIGDAQKPCILLRADSDGLKTAEETGLPYASHNGNMHLCGHDIHTAQLLGAARLLKEDEKSLPVCVKLMFQSAEEILSGAKDMIDCGILCEPSPICAAMIHVMTATELETGTVIIPEHGESAPCADFFEITVNGKSCHGSSPHMGKDALYSACNIVTALSHISARELSVNDRAMITVGSLNSGSSANIISGKAVIKGSMRCFGKELRKKLSERITETATYTASAFGTSANTVFTSTCPSLVNAKEMCEAASEILPVHLGAEKIKRASEFDTGNTVGGSEDFAYVAERIPSVMLALCAGNIRDGHTYPLHHPKVTFDETAMAYGCCTLVSLCEFFLRKNMESAE